MSKRTVANLGIFMTGAVVAMALGLSFRSLRVYFLPVRQQVRGGLQSPPDYQKIQQACRPIIVPFDPDCPRVLAYRISEGVGIGHQFTELLFGLRKAHSYGLAYMFEPFGHSATHRDNYTAINELLGLPALFQAVGGINKSWTEQLVNTMNAEWTQLNPRVGPGDTARKCNAFYQSGGYHTCYSDPKDHNCFYAPESAHLFEDASECLRMASREFGTAFDKCVFLKDPSATLPRDTLYVVWHVRLGDMTLHSPDDASYNVVLHQLRNIAPSYKIRIFLVGKGDTGSNGTSRVTSQYVDQLRAHVDTVWNGSEDQYRPGVIAPYFTFEDVFLAMMHADVLIGSGSSMPAIAALVSSVPLFFNHVPKHGYNFGAEMTTNDVDMESSGTILDSQRRLRIAIYRRLNPLQSTACRTVVA